MQNNQVCAQITMSSPLSTPSPGVTPVPGTTPVPGVSNIEPTDLYVDPLDCYEPCNIYISPTWLNYGDTVETFVPTLIIDGVSYSFDPVSLTPGGGIMLEYDMPGLAVGTHSIGISPDSTGTYVETVNVRPVS